MAWNGISQETKAIILGIKSPTTPPPSNRRSMLHDMTALDFFENLYDFTPEPSPDVDIDNADGQ